MNNRENTAAFTNPCFLGHPVEFQGSGKQTTLIHVLFVFVLPSGGNPNTKFSNPNPHIIKS